MNLVLDFGNTRIKAGVFKENELVETQIFNTVHDLLISNIISTFTLSASSERSRTAAEGSIHNCLIASVTNTHLPVLEKLGSKFNTKVFKADTPIPLKNLYKSALTLGSDRIAAAVGSFSFYPNQDVLTIDAGTCIKYNFVNASNEYLGGAISPGIPMRLKAMHEYTSALPSVELDQTFENLIGRNTTESMLSGAITGAACEVDEMINRYKKIYNKLQVVITGGDADYLCKQLKNPFFANQNILLYGLNSILKFNIEK